MVYINNRLNYRRSNRPKAFWGAFAPAAINFVGGLITSSQQSRAQKRAIEEQKRLAQQQLDISNQNNLAATLNNYADTQNSYDDTNYNLKYRNGGTRRLGSNSIVITDGGNARRIGNDTFLLRGGSHEDVNETGQTGIGINVGGNEIEAEGGEVAQKKNNSVRIFSAQPMLAGGLSPAQAILRGYNKDKVFAAQQAFKRRNGIADNGDKARHGTTVPYGRIHINEDGTFTDTLTGKTYDTSATNGEDVVITGKANHWKEAGKHDTSRYFDPMGAVTFASAAGAPILNFTPSNIVGSIREAKDYTSFMNSFMNNNNGGFFDKDYAEKHPYISFLGNMVGDAAAGYLGNKGIDLVRGRMNYAPYRKLTYKVNTLAKQTGLWGHDSYINYNDYAYKGAKEYRDAMYRRFPDKYGKRLGTDEELEKLRNYYKNNTDYNYDRAKSITKPTLKYYDLTEGEIDKLAKIYQNNPEYATFIAQSKFTINPLAQATVDAFLEHQGRSIRGVHSNNLEEATKYLTTTEKGRYMSGGDRLNTNGGLYTSNSSDIANRFKNPETGKSNGYVGKLQYYFNVDRTKPIEDQLYQARSQVYFDPTLSEAGYQHPFNHNEAARKLVRKNPNIKAIEANYGRRNGKFLFSNERGYLPSENSVYGEVETPVHLRNVNEYTAATNQRGRWGAGNTDNSLFISQTPNNTTDFIRDARVLLGKTKDIGKLTQLETNEENRRFERFYKAEALKNKTRYGNYDYNNKSITEYFLNRLIDKLTKSKKHKTGYTLNKQIDKNINDLPFRLGSRIRFAKGGKVKYNKPDYYHWMHQTSDNLKVNPIDSDYDYRAYYNSATPWELANTMYNAKNGHFTDIGKRPNHPTFSNESKYSNSKTPGGTWNGDVFVPTIWQFANNGNKIRNRYMNNTGEGYFDGRRNVYPKYRIGGRIKARNGLTSSYKIIPDGGVPGTDSYSPHRMRSGYDASPLNLLNTLNYLDRYLGFVDENGNSRYITGIAPVYGRISTRNFQQLAKASKASYTLKQTYAKGQPILANIKDYYTTSPRTIERSAKHMTDGANPFLYTGDISIKAAAKNVLNGSKQAYTNVKGKITNPDTYRYSNGAERVRDTNGRLVWRNNYKLRPWVKLTAAAATGAGLLTGIGAGLSNIKTEDKEIQKQLDAYGNPVSPYIAKPNVKQTNNQTKKDTTQVPDSIRKPAAKKDSVVTPVFKQALGKDSVRKDTVKPTRTVAKPQQKVTPVKQDTTRVDTTRQVKTVPQQKKVVTPQYKGNVTKGNYQLHDGESKVINGVKYTRIGNNIFNHKTNVSYVYDKNGNYTGQADYSKVGKNFNDAFDAARAAGRSNFIYNAGKYRNYSTAKEEDAKKEARNRAVGLKRIAKKCGGIVTPRRKYLPGGTANPWDEYKPLDYGGVSPWQVSNKYNVTYPYAITKYDLPIVNVTANRNNFSNEVIKKVKTAPQTTPSSSTIDTPYLGRHSSFKPATQDYIGLGIDTLAALGSGIFARNAYNKLNFDYNLPSYIDESPVAFDTTYHNEAQRANVERNRINGRNLIQGNTASAQTALSRMQEGDTNAMLELNKLADEKANKEVELRNQNAANEQQVRARNAAARNQYYQNVAQIQNAALEAKNNAALAKAQSIGTDLSGLAQAWSNFATSIENRYDSRQNQIAMVAKANNPTVTQTALKMGYDFSPETLAGLYNTTTDANLKRLILGRLSTRDRIKYGIQ